MRARSGEDARSAGRSETMKNVEARATGARWLPAAVFAGAGLLHFAVWAAIPFRPFTIYKLAASLRAAGRLEPFRVPDFSPFYFHLHLLLARTGLSYAPILHAVEILATALTAALFARLCLEFFPARVSAAGSLLFVLSPAPLLLSQLLLPEVWRLLFDVSALLAFVLFRRTCRLRHVIAAALLLGLSASTRPTALVLAVALAAALLVTDGLEALRPAAVLVAGPLLFLSLIALRNAALTGSVDPTVMDPGAVFYLGTTRPAAERSPIPRS